MLASEGHLGCAHTHVQQDQNSKNYIRAVFRSAVCFQGGSSPVRAMVLLSSKLDSFGVKSSSAVNMCIDLAILSLHVPLPRESACAFTLWKATQTPADSYGW